MFHLGTPRMGQSCLGTLGMDQGCSGTSGMDQGILSGCPQGAASNGKDAQGNALYPHGITIIIPNCPCSGTWMSPRFRCERGLCLQIMLFQTILGALTIIGGHISGYWRAAWHWEKAQGPWHY